MKSFYSVGAAIEELSLAPSVVSIGGASHFSGIVIIMEESKDLAQGMFVEKWPHWLRWLLFLPAAIVVPLVIQGIGRIMTASFLGIESNAFIIEVYSDLVMGGGVVLIGALVAPKKQFLIGVILLVLMAILVAGPFLTPGAVAHWGATSLIHVLISVGAGIAAIYQLHEFQNK